MTYQHIYITSRQQGKYLSKRKIASVRPAYLNVASPSCPYGFSLNDFDSFGEEGEAYPKGRNRNAKHSAATTLQPPLLFDALEWRSKVEFRAAAPVRPAPPVLKKKPPQQCEVAL